MSNDLYLLVDGTHASPDDCDVGADNELRHNENGVPVALDADGKPQKLSKLVLDAKNVEAAEAGVKASDEAEQINAENKAAAEAEATEPEGPLTEIDPATGKAASDDLLLTTADVAPVPEKAPAKAAPVKAKAAVSAKPKTYKNRELKAR